MHEFLDTRFGDDGKLWHLAVIAAVGVTAWAVLISTTIALVNFITGY